MKKIVKALLVSVLFAVIVLQGFAENIDVIFNRVRICVDGITKTSWNQNIENSDLPSSITYKDTTYVPLRWISGNMGKNVAWNGDSKTVSITDRIGNSISSTIKKEDLNGNVWKYEVRLAGNNAYLIVSDEKRGYERFYRLANKSAYKFTEDGVYFVYVNHAFLYLPFLHNDDNADGVFIGISARGNEIHSFYFDGDYVIWAENFLATTSPHGYLSIANLKTKKFNRLDVGTDKVNELSVKKSDDDTYVLTYIQGKYGPSETEEVMVNKDSLEFSEVKTILRVHETAADYVDKLTLKNFTFLVIDMSMDEIYTEVGEADCVDGDWVIYKLEEGSELLLKTSENKLSEAVIKVNNGTKIPIGVQNDGKLKIYEPVKQEG